MSVQNGREFLAIPGPTTVPDAVLNAMHRPAIEIYSGELVGITDACLARLKQVFRTAGNAYIYAANGHGAWEAAVPNVLSRGDAVLVLQSGRFAVGWGETAEMLGVQVETLAFGWRHAVDPAAVEAQIRGKSLKDAKAILDTYGQSQLTVWPDWVGTIPTLEQRVDVRLAESVEP